MAFTNSAHSYYWCWRLMSSVQLWFWQWTVLHLIKVPLDMCSRINMPTQPIMLYTMCCVLVIMMGYSWGYGSLWWLLNMRCKIQCVYIRECHADLAAGIMTGMEQLDPKCWDRLYHTFQMTVSSMILTTAGMAHRGDWQAACLHLSNDNTLRYI